MHSLLIYKEQQQSLNLQARKIAMKVTEEVEMNALLLIFPEMNKFTMQLIN